MYELDFQQHPSQIAAKLKRTTQTIIIKCLIIIYLENINISLIIRQPWEEQKENLRTERKQALNKSNQEKRNENKNAVIFVRLDK